jgi:Cupin domain
VTGHDAEGRSVIVSDGPPEREQRMPSHGVTLREIWNTRGTPVPIFRVMDEPAEVGVVLAPPSGGTRIRICDFEPETQDRGERAGSLEDFEAIGAGAAYRGTADGAHAMMHRTETIDYGIVLEGEIVLILDTAETLLKAGDIAVQVGTSHAWSNRSGRMCRMAFILVDGEFEAGLRPG